MIIKRYPVVLQKLWWQQKFSYLLSLVNHLLPALYGPGVVVGVVDGVVGVVVGVVDGVVVGVVGVVVGVVDVTVVVVTIVDGVVVVAVGSVVTVGTAFETQTAQVGGNLGPPKRGCAKPGAPTVVQACS